jgi:hypothetical protein
MAGWGQQNFLSAVGKPASYRVSVNLNKKGDSVDPSSLWVSSEFIDNYKQGELIQTVANPWLPVKT